MTSPPIEKFQPLLVINEINDAYIRMAKRLGLPAFYQKYGKGFFSGNEPHLILWENESIEVKKDKLWINLGTLNEGANVIDWAFTFQKKWGLLSLGGSPVPDSDVVALNSQYVLFCTNARLVAYLIHSRFKGVHSEKKHIIIHFPWSMLKRLKCIKKGKPSFGSEQLYCIEFLFGLRNMNYFLYIGPITFNDRVDFLTTLDRIALKAKIEFIRQVTDLLPENTVTETKSNTLISLQKLQSELEDKTRIKVEEEFVSASQTYLPSLDPFIYYASARATK